MLNVIMLSVIILSVIMLSVMTSLRLGGNKVFRINCYYKSHGHCLDINESQIWGKIDRFIFQKDVDYYSKYTTFERPNLFQQMTFTLDIF
jgi:hypothetical protein